MIAKIKNFMRDCGFFIQLPYLLLAGKLLGGQAGFDSDYTDTPVPDLSPELLDALGISDHYMIRFISDQFLLQSIHEWSIDKFDIHIITSDNEINFSASFNDNSFIASSELLATIQAAEFIIKSTRRS